MTLAPEEITAKNFTMSLRGLDRDEVVAFLEEVAAQQRELLERLDASTSGDGAAVDDGEADALRAQIAELQSRLAEAEAALASMPAAGEHASSEAADEELLEKLIETEARLAEAEQRAAEAETRAAAASASAAAAGGDVDLETALGQEVAEIVRVARTTAKSVRDSAAAELERAKQEADSALLAAREQAAQLSASAAEELERARHEADLHLSAAKETAQATVASAESQAARLVEDANSTSLLLRTEAERAVEEAKQRADALMQEAMLRHERVVAAGRDAAAAIADADAKIASLRSALDQVQAIAGAIEHVVSAPAEEPAVTA